MVNHSSGKDYKVYPIVECLENEIYFGSIIKDHLGQRMVNHRSKYKIWANETNVSKLMIYDLFDRYCVQNCIIKIIEKVDATSCWLEKVTI